MPKILSDSTESCPLCMNPSTGRHYLLKWSRAREAKRGGKYVGPWVLFCPSCEITRKEIPETEVKD